MNRLFQSLFPLFLLCAPLCRGAEPAPDSLSFEATEWDFGAIGEHDGSVSHTFRYTNCGSRPVVIQSVRTTCGCVTPRYSQTPVLRGKTGEIRILFDPTGRPGAFDKKLSVKFSGSDDPATLSVRGTVLASQRSREQAYPFPAGEALRLTHEALNFSLQQQGAAQSFTVGYVNDSDRDIRLTFRTIPAAVWLRADDPDIVRAGTAGKVSVTCRVTGDSIFGRRSCRLIPYVDGRAAGEGIPVTVVATDSFEGVDPDDAPRLTIDAAYHEFGSVRAKEQAEHTFTLTNTGIRPLVVRSVQSSPGVEISPLAPFTVAPGSKAALRCRITAANPGKFTGVVTLVTNAPAQPLRNLRLSADIRR